MTNRFPKDYGTKLRLHEDTFVFSCKYFSLSELGALVLNDPGLRNDVMRTCMAGIRWPDSPSGTRAAALVELIIPK